MSEVAQATSLRLPPWVGRQGVLFNERFAEWQQCRTELLQLDNEIQGEVEPDDYDKRHDEVKERLENAARLAMTTHAPDGSMIWQKFQILEDALHGDGEGEWTDQRAVWMLACIKANLMAVGIGGRS